MKSRFIVLLFCLLSQVVHAQRVGVDTLAVSAPSPVGDTLALQTQRVRLDTPGMRPVDSSVLTGPVLPFGVKNVSGTSRVTRRILQTNPWIRTQNPVNLITTYKTVGGKEIIFYILLFLLFYLGIFKTVFPAYFTNLFLIFFNTSLRQSQITDQLSQSRLPSFLLNIFFVLSGGIYVWLLLLHFNKMTGVDNWLLLLFSIGAIAIVYLVKFLVIHFLGWIAGVRHAAQTYIFVIFLVNKILGILLLPFIILLMFGPATWTAAVVTISAMVVGMLFLSRYFKALGAFQSPIPVSRMQFLLLIAGVEVLPLFIFFKVIEDYLV